MLQNLQKYIQREIHNYTHENIKLQKLSQFSSIKLYFLSIRKTFLNNRNRFVADKSQIKHFKLNKSL